MYVYMFIYVYIYMRGRGVARRWGVLGEGKLWDKGSGIDPTDI
jgi:hypothetical protein